MKKNNMDVVYKYFVDEGLDKKSPKYFQENASSIIEKMKEDIWYQIYEPQGLEIAKNKMLSLINAEDLPEDPLEAVETFIACNAREIYKINLSRTQSNRSITGSTFENILELVLLFAGVPVESQRVLSIAETRHGKSEKEVDLVVPGSVEYKIDNMNSKLISLKTTLRERSEQVAAEQVNINVPIIYLAHVDDKISQDLMLRCHQQHMKLVTTKKVYNSYLNKAINNINSNEEKISESERLIKENKEQILKLEEEINRRRVEGGKIRRLEISLGKLHRQISKAEQTIDFCTGRRSELESAKQNVEIFMMTFEDMIQECLEVASAWEKKYTEEQKNNIGLNYVEMIGRNSDYEKILLIYMERIMKLRISISDEKSKEILENMKKKYKKRTR